MVSTFGGTVDNTATPGPEMSTWALNCENVAQLSVSSLAATEMTFGNDAG